LEEEENNNDDKFMKFSLEEEKEEEEEEEKSSKTQKKSRKKTKKKKKVIEDPTLLSKTQLSKMTNHFSDLILPAESLNISPTTFLTLFSRPDRPFHLHLISTTSSSNRCDLGFEKREEEEEEWYMGDNNHNQMEDHNFFPSSPSPTIQPPQFDQLPSENDKNENEIKEEQNNQYGLKLIDVGRQVEKLTINYSKKAKRMNVRQLKNDIWDKISTTSPTTFQDMMEDREQYHNSSNVSVPFMFISLLHLANEHGLEITQKKDKEGNKDLTNLNINI